MNFSTVTFDDEQRGMHPRHAGIAIGAGDELSDGAADLGQPQHGEQRQHAEETQDQGEAAEYPRTNPDRETKARTTISWMTKTLTSEDLNEWTGWGRDQFLAEALFEFRIERLDRVGEGLTIDFLPDDLHAFLATKI